jgi:hypothetical protein
VISRPDAQLSKHHPSGPSSMSRNFELFQLASVRTSQQHGQTPLSVRQGKGPRSKTQIWEDSCNRPDNVCSHLDAILHKASHAYKVLLFGRRSSWTGCSSFIYGNSLHQFNHPDYSLHGPDSPSLDMEIACN